MSVTVHFDASEATSTPYVEPEGNFRYSCACCGVLADQDGLPAGWTHSATLGMGSVVVVCQESPCSRALANYDEAWRVHRKGAAPPQIQTRVRA